MGKTLAGDYFIYPPSSAPILSFLASRGKGLLESWGGGEGGANSDVADVADVALRILFYGLPQNELLIMIRVFN